MALARKTDTILVNKLNLSDPDIAYVGVRIRAYAGGMEQQLYSDDIGTPLSAAITDENGLYDFWIEEGDYTLNYSIGGQLLGSETASIFTYAAVSQVKTSVGSGSGDIDDPLAQARLALPSQGGSVLIRPGEYDLFTQPLSGPNVIWQADGVDINGGSPVLPGVIETLTDTGGRFYRKAITVPDDGPVFRVQREANHAGGTDGSVNFAGEFVTIAGSSNTNYEWALIGRVENYATGTQQNVGTYAQALNRADGNTWAFCGEQRDAVPLPNPTRAKIGIEVGFFGEGSDNNSNRVGYDLPAHNGNAGAGQYVLTWGYRVNGGFTPFQSTIKNCFHAFGVNFQKGFSTVGANLIDGPFNGAVTMAETQPIAWSDVSERKIRFISGKWQFYGPSVEYAYVSEAGAVGASQRIEVGGNQVVGQRQAAIANPTDAASTQAAVISILNALRTHGLIST